MRAQKNSHVLARGLRIFKTTYSDDDGKLHIASKWYCEFRFDGRARRVPAFTDRGQSEELARQIQKLAHVRESGATIDPSLAAWVEAMLPALRKRLVKVGVLDAMQQS